MYEGETPSKTITGADSNCGIRVRKIKGGEYALPTNPKKGHTGKRNTKNVVSPSEKITGATNTCLLHGPRQSYEDWKVLKEYSKKHAAQRQKKENKAHYSGKTNSGKYVELDRNMK